MNEISRTADEGDIERCEKCGQMVAANLILPVMQNGVEICACLFCLAELKLIAF